MSAEAVIQSQSPDLPRPGSSEYSEAHYKFLSKLIGSQFAISMYEQIDASDLSMQCKIGGYKILIQLFDQNAMLANHPGMTSNDQAMRYINCDIVLLLWVFECVESDIQNPQFMTIQENIRIAYRDFINRPQERAALFKSESSVKYDGLNNPVSQNQPGRTDLLRGR